jgi:cytochrome c oxidase subunit 3
MASTDSSRYYQPAPSHWPVVGSSALFLLAFGTVLLLNDSVSGWWPLAGGAGVLTYMLFGWFGTIIRESEAGKYNSQVDQSFRWAMGWFIFSEVMFFAAFFGALFYMRVLSVPWLGEGDTGALLWQNFEPGWPVSGPGLTEPFTPMGALGIPAINTLILLFSGATVTWAHWGLKLGDRRQLKVGLFLTVVLGSLFLALQVYEYAHAYSELGLTLGTGAYGATFFLLTGFHGLHVTLGTIMLIVIFFRALRGHFKPEHHFGFEAVSWYWHFVDVVWLLLFVLVYWL